MRQVLFGRERWLADIKKAPTESRLEYHLPEENIRPAEAEAGRGKQNFARFCPVRHQVLW
jgi:hypothetical protein